jgi:hypothetical protein
MREQKRGQKQPPKAKKIQKNAKKQLKMQKTRDLQLAENQIFKNKIP